MDKVNTVISQTENWIRHVVVGLNFCPFASKPLRNNSIYYQVEEHSDKGSALASLMSVCNMMMSDPQKETSFLIFSNAFHAFEAYLDVLDLAEQLLKKEQMEGIFQIASFHPLYQFAGSELDDPANYTNRSPYPMFHILREDSLERILEKYNNTHQIPENNITTARQLGLEKLKILLESCF